ncbi:hydrolase [Mycobacterium sp. MS1601]|uniref:NlpC/P60 family peptidoglycan-binding protein RipD n=1 Tax=Mycobacterium sp. MS1601 TaxID=1936029 RepID=UPI00097905AB|nr:NlpC/P60 family peptidoglycan-binding protein RipD [Mycobacterium sp. MS1601]AQA06756.1 hydrolase [Mycobacterium sp. MS1601]
MSRRVYAIVCSLAVLMASVGIGLGAGTASADPFGRTPEQLQAINVVISRALAARGVPFTYGGGNADGPTKGEARPAAAAITDSSAPATEPTAAISVPPALGGLTLAPTATAPSTPLPAAVPDVVGFDASGLIVYAFGGVGIKMPRSSGEQYRAVRKVLPAQALPGDLLFYGPDGTQSVALFVGNGQMVEVGDKGVAVSPVRTTDMTPYLGRIIG